MDGKLALISGGARGIGEATARLFRSRGARVIIADTLRDEGEALANEIGARFELLDVREELAWAALSGDIDILVNNAGILRRGAVDQCSAEDMRATLEVNLIGALNGIRAVAPGMRARGGGAIVNVASVASIAGYGGLAAYVTSKHALLGLTRASALDLADDGIRVNAVLPGQTSTPMTSKWSPSPRLVPMGRSGRSEEIAALIAFLASSAASFTTGAAYTADGGLTAGFANAIPRPQ